MRKRPLCFICITLVLIMWILQTSGDEKSSSDVIHSENKEVTVCGKIYQCEYKENYQILYLEQAVLSVDSQKQKLNNVKITYTKGTLEYMVSDIVCAKGSIVPVSEASNPGQFDMESYYQAKKISYTMWEPVLELLERSDISVRRELYSARNILAKQYDQILNNQYGALLKGIILGDKSDLDEELKELFQKAGISHILAISGLHLQILGSSLYKALRKCRFSIGIAALISGVLLGGYGYLTGNNVATIRALIMFLISIGAEVTGRTYDGRTSIALSAVVLIAGNPFYLSYSGFWLSFCAVSSFLVFREKRRLTGGILLYFFMAPIMLNYFYELSLYSVLLNLLVVPTVGVVLIFGVVGAAGSFISIGLGRILVFPAVVLLHIYKILCEVNEILPNYNLILGKPTWVQIIMYYGIMAGTLILFRRYRLQKRRFVLLLMMIPAWLLLTYRGIQGVQITMLDAGQGDAMVIRTETGNTYLIDGGSTSEDDIGKYRILPYLKYEGADRLEAVFITHADADHMNGIIEVLEMIKMNKTTLSIEKIVVPDWEDMTAFLEVYRLATECGIEVYRFEEGETVIDGEMIINCIHPAGEDYTDTLNEGSLVLRLDYKEFSMLFTGDLEGEAENRNLGEYGNIDVLKVAHHGSRNSTDEAFLEEVQPELALISCGENNSYGHPHEELLKRLESAEAKIFQTSLHGAITIRTDGEKIDLKTYKQYNEP